MYSPQYGAAATAPWPPGIDSRELAWPTQKAVEIFGVKPTNHASVKLSVVPVLPPAGQPILGDAGARVDVVLEDLRGLVGLAVGEDPRLGRLVGDLAVAVGEDDLG